MQVMHKAPILESKQIEHVLNERRILEEASSHPFCVGLVRAYQDKPCLYLLQEWVGGQSCFPSQRLVWSSYRESNVSCYNCYCTRTLSLTCYTPPRPMWLHTLPLQLRALSFEPIIKLAPTPCTLCPLPSPSPKSPWPTIPQGVHTPGHQRHSALQTSLSHKSKIDVC